jgi:hypothetical protein
MIILRYECVVSVSVGNLDTLPRHSHALMLSTLPANTAADVGGISPVLEVVRARCCQGGLQLL